MPIIKSAKKRVKQNEVARVRNHSQLSKMRSFIKNIVRWVEGGELKKAEDVFNDAQKAIDTCAKKNLIHKNNAARKKSRISKLISRAKAHPQQEKEVASKAKKTTKTSQKPVAKKQVAEKKTEE